MRIQENVSYLFDKLTTKCSLVQDDPGWDPLFDDFCKVVESVEVSTERSELNQKEKPKKKQKTASSCSKNRDEPGITKGTQKQKRITKRKNTQKADNIVEDEIDFTCSSSRSKKMRVVYSDEEGSVEGGGDNDSLNRKLAIGCYVQVVSGHFNGLYASVQEKIEKNLWRIQYFQQQLGHGKWTLKEGHLDSRLSSELKLVVGIPDNRSRFDFKEVDVN